MLLYTELTPRQGRVNDHLVKIVKPHPFQCFINGLCRRCVGFQLCRHLAGNKQLLPGSAAGAHTLANAPLIAVGLCGVDQPVAQLDCCADSFGRLIIVNKPSTKARLGDLNAICQRVCFFQNYDDFSLLF